MTEMLSYPFFLRALAAGVIVSVLCGLLSVFVVLRRMAFIGAGISHAAFGGVALGFLIGTDPVLTGTTYAAATAVLIDRVVRQGRISEDAAIGIFFSASMALGVIFIGFSGSHSVDVFGYLFGNILTVGTGELALMAIGGGAIALYIICNFKELFVMSFSEELAFVSGIPTKRLSLGLLVALSLVIVISMKVVGLVLVAALLVIPAVCARILTANIVVMTALSIIFALISSISGLFVSAFADLPSGGTIVVLLSLFFFTLLPFKK